MPKNPEKTRLVMSRLCILIGLSALAVAIVAIAMKQYIIFAAMLLVTVWQYFNFKAWTKKN